MNTYCVYLNGDSPYDYFDIKADRFELKDGYFMFYASEGNIVEALVGMVVANLVVYITKEESED